MIALSSQAAARRQVVARLLAGGLGVSLLSSGLLARLLMLQVQEHGRYTTLAQDNRIKLLPLPPPRGLIYDRTGKVLADNLPTYSLEITPDQTPDLEDTLLRLADVVQLDTADLQQFHKLHKRLRRFDALPIRLRLSEAEIACFAVRQHRFPGVELALRRERYYPHGVLTAHVVGYVGRIDPQDLTTLSLAAYSGSTHTGKSGLEKSYETMLHGTVGYQHVETNVHGKIVRVLAQTPPQPGRDLQLHLDLALQKAALEALGDFNGAVVALEPATGGVLALASNPSFDPNLFVNGISNTDYQALQQNPDKPQLNRALRGAYPPGSTVKPFVALAGLELGEVNAGSGVNCHGFYTLPGQSHRFHCWNRRGHGGVNLKRALAQSCDVYFYELARQLGIERLHDYLERFGFGAVTGIDLAGEVPGLLPNTAWKQRAKKQAWYPGETLICGIGQGAFTATPLQLAQAAATFARRGKVLPPRLVSNAPPTPDKPHRELPAAYWRQVLNGMIEVVHGASGTARKVGLGAAYVMAGKTGTAQVFSLKQGERYSKNSLPLHLRDHALFIALAPAENPKIAVAVLAENGGGGSAIAAPIARKVIDAYLGGSAVGAP
jgi:penicillin-binding protein 2